MKHPHRLWLPAVYAALGFLAVWVPWRMAVAKGSRAPNPVDGFQLGSLGFLVLVGAVGGFTAPRASIWWAMLSMGAFPLLAFVEMFRDPTSHNLFPFEFAMYGAISLCAAFGAFIAREIRRRSSPPDP